MAIIQIQPHATQALTGIIEAWEMSVTVQESSASKRPYRIDYRSARLEVRPHRAGAEPVILVPAETGGWLAQDRYGPQGMIVKFRWPAVPRWPDRAPDLAHGATVVLSNVEGQLNAKRSIHGALPQAESTIPSAYEIFVEPTFERLTGSL